MTLTFVFMEVTDSLLVGEDDSLILSDDLPPEVLPARRQLAQFFQLTHPAHLQSHSHLLRSLMVPFLQVTLKPLVKMAHCESQASCGSEHMAV